MYLSHTAILLFQNHRISQIPKQSNSHIAFGLWLSNTHRHRHIQRQRHRECSRRQWRQSHTRGCQGQTGRSLNAPSETVSPQARMPTSTLCSLPRFLLSVLIGYNLDYPMCYSKFAHVGLGIWLQICYLF